MGGNEFANEKSHINGIESFWAYAKLRLSKMKGIRNEMFYLHLKRLNFALTIGVIMSMYSF